MLTPPFLQIPFTVKVDLRASYVGNDPVFVVQVDIRGHLAAVIPIFRDSFGEIVVHGIEHKPMLFAPIHGVFEKIIRPARPKDDPVSLGLLNAEIPNELGVWLPDLRPCVPTQGAVEINGDHLRRIAGTAHLYTAFTAYVAYGIIPSKGGENYGRY